MAGTRKKKLIIGKWKIKGKRFIFITKKQIFREILKEIELDQIISRF